MSRRSRRRAGFTLVELMVSLTAGLIALGTLYTFSKGSARYFQQQNAVGVTQQNVRAAFERIRRDVQRAGFGGVPYGDIVRTAGLPTVRVQAIEVCDGNGEGLIPNEAANLTHADRLVLTGNYSSNDVYLASRIEGNNTLLFQPSWPAFQRSFGVRTGAHTDPALTVAICDPAAFSRVWKVDRWVHVKSREGASFFSRITAVTPDASCENARVQIDPGIPTGGALIGGIGEGAIVSPLDRIEYTVLREADLAAAGLDALAPTHPDAAALGDVPAVLVRREVAFGTTACSPPTVIANTTQVVLEYVAHFDVDAIVDDAIPPNLPNFIFEGDAQVTARSQGASLNAGPHQFRSLFVNLAGRAPTVEKNFPWVARAAVTEPLSRFQVSAGDVFAARVREIRSEIALPNLFPMTQR